MSDIQICSDCNTRIGDYYGYGSNWFGYSIGLTGGIAQSSKLIERCAICGVGAINGWTFAGETLPLIAMQHPQLPFGTFVVRA